jgi:putative resolvase
MATTGYITTREAKKALGVCEDTLRRWADSGLFPSIRSPGGKRLYNITEYIKQQRSGSEGTVGEGSKAQEEKQRICYCRVSSQGQKDDLQRQIGFMQREYPNHKIIQDIGSGINFKRKGLRSIMELTTKGLVSEVVVAYRDRLCRFAFELLEWFFHLHGVKLVVLNEALDASEQGELVEDLVAIINVFNCRINGKRKYDKGKEGDKAKKDQGDEEEHQTCV